jgi:hypothetical protein
MAPSGGRLREIPPRRGKSSPECPRARLRSPGAGRLPSPTFALSVLNPVFAFVALRRDDHDGGPSERQPVPAASWGAYFSEPKTALSPEDEGSTATDGASTREADTQARDHKASRAFEYKSSDQNRGALAARAR